MVTKKPSEKGNVNFLEDFCFSEPCSQWEARLELLLILDGSPRGWEASFALGGPSFPPILHQGISFSSIQMLNIQRKPVWMSARFLACLRFPDPTLPVLYLRILILYLRSPSSLILAHQLCKCYLTISSRPFFSQALEKWPRWGTPCAPMAS